MRTGVINYTYRRLAATRDEVNEQYERMLRESFSETALAIEIDELARRNPGGLCITKDDK